MVLKTFIRIHKINNTSNLIFHLFPENSYLDELVKSSVVMTHSFETPGSGH